MESQNPLAHKYPDLPGSKPVERAVSQQLRAGEAGPKTKDERVDVYMNRLERVLSHERGFELLKHKLLKSYTLDDTDPEVVKRVAEGLFESEKKIATERGQGEAVKKLEQVRDVLAQYEPSVHEKAEIQRRSLSSWLDYLQQNDGQLPMWFRYYVVRSLGNMGSFDKDRLVYNKRGPTSVAPFPELNSEALGFVFNLLDKGVDAAKELPEEKKPALAKLLQSKDFPKLYAFAQTEMAGKADRTSIEGEWKKYPKGSDFTKLEADLYMKNTGWCTAQGSAKSQLSAGDFYVYYSKAASGANTEPRIAIRMEQDQVAEIRGIAPRQELEPNLVETAQAKYKDLPGGDKYEKKASDMKRLTLIAKKTEKSELLTKAELIFLYEIDSKIESFGYQRDPRIDELRKQRDPKIDAPIVLECGPKQIATSEKEITPDTKTYIGPLFPGIFKLNIENIFTRFPEGKIRFSELEIGEKTKDEYVASIKKEGIEITRWAQYLLDNKDFTTKKSSGDLMDYLRSRKSEPENLDLVRLTVADLGFPQGATVKEIYERAERFGLELCPAEVGPAQRLKDADQATHDWYNIAMKPIADSVGYLSVFLVHHDDDGRDLDAHHGHPDYWYDADDFWAFRVASSS